MSAIQRIKKPNEKLTALSCNWFIKKSSYKGKWFYKEEKSMLNTGPESSILYHRTEFHSNLYSADCTPTYYHIHKYWLLQDSVLKVVSFRCSVQTKFLMMFAKIC